MRILIVGCGYVGLPLGAELARRGHTVFGLGRQPSRQMVAANIIPLAADITRPETLNPCRMNLTGSCTRAASGGGSAQNYRRLYV